jgi:hypothetical protein
VPIEIADYDPHWPVTAAAAAAELRRALPGLFTELEHVGSTSVPGLAAKPVIDLMAAVPALAAVTDHEAALLALGYWRLDAGMPGRLFYPPRPGTACAPTTCTSCPPPPRRPATSCCAITCAATRPTPAATPTSSGSWPRGGEDPAAYTRAKTGLIQELTDRARADRGLPSVPVWEE